MYRKVYQTRSFNAKEKMKYMIWTNEMDRCLAKILAEQVKKGNKIDNTLKTEAYMAALAALNENFGLDLTKEHIKSRLKTWKKQYGVLKELLAQKGFEWDEARKMVVADDSVWNDYIKAHSDARLFRAKFIENYDELCIIIGNNQALVRCSENGAQADVDLTAENEGVETAIVSEIQSDEKQAKNLRWTEEMDHCLGKILVQQVKKGCKIDNILQREAYTTAVTALNEKFGPYVTKDHIRNRLRTWKKQYGVLTELLSHTGFEWDKTRKMIIANDSIWNDYVKAHPDAKLFRGRVIKNHDDLWIIFGNECAFESSSRSCDALLSSTPDNEVVEAPDTSQIRSGSTKEQSKYMIWTKEMDSCLGKILVEQVKQVVDSNLKSAAYTLAVTALNKRFQLDLVKDHIKNRLRTWKKQYGILKELLDQNGFEWDETLKLVVADDSVWDDYIKTHPEARAFRSRVVENYDHLCIIFGNNHAVESYSRTGDDVVLCLATDFESVETVDTSPIRCGDDMKDQVKNMRWTSEMDRYLCKILVEQVKMGNKNKLDNKLKPAAYIAAISALDERFQLDLTKDHVRNRLKTWKKLYGSLKELLNQSEFEWDETRKMVIADDTVWNDYIKINPDARLLQGRIIENYDELCIIIGNDNPTESCSRNGAEAYLDLTAENEGVETEDAFQNQSANAKEKGKYIIWTDEMDRCLTEKLVEQVKLGNKFEKNLKPVAYMAALTALNEKFGLDLTKENIRSRLKTWKKLYGLVKELLSYSGFEWDEGRKMVIANDSVWNEYIKAHPDAKFLRARSIENYNELSIIIGNNQGARYWPRTGAKVDVTPTSNNEEHVETPLEMMLVDEEMSQEDTGDGMQGSSQQTRARPSSSSRSKQPFKKRRGSDVMVEMMSAMAANIGRIADALMESNKTVCLDELFEMVQNIPGFDDDLIIEACEYLSFDDKRATMFLKLDERLRKLWLLKRLHGQSS